MKKKTDTQKIPRGYRVLYRGVNGVTFLVKKNDHGMDYFFPPCGAQSQHHGKLSRKQPEYSYAVARLDYIKYMKAVRNEKTPAEAAGVGEGQE